MNTPIRDFVNSYAEKNGIRFHMPGHKGKSFIGVEKYDITEIGGADVLYNAQGIIKESESNAAALFSSLNTFYSCEGSSLCIKAMLALVASHRKNKLRKTRILAARNVHKAFIYGCAICDVEVEWFYGNSNHLCSCNITADMLETCLSEIVEPVDAVYITSPDYLGNISDVGALSRVCDKFSLPLLVDNAHGAYLAFLKKSLHPINNGAYMCCDSAHKTLPVLTGGAYLHFSEKSKMLIDKAEGMMAMMGSTSPSYLILQSLDLCNRYLAEGYKENLVKLCDEIASLKNKLTLLDYVVCPSEPLKLTLDLLLSNLDSESLLKYLRIKGIEPEFSDNNYIVFMFTCENSTDEISELYNVLSLYNRTPSAFKKIKAAPVVKAPKVMSIREAFFSLKETVLIGEAEGRICADPSVSCPPAVPVVVSGELITEKIIEMLKYYGVEKIDVVI